MEARSLNVTNRILQHSRLESIGSDVLAVLIYGHLRTFLYTLPATLKSLAKLGELHLYIHTWDSLNVLDDADPALIDIPLLIYSVCNKARVVSLQVDHQPHQSQANNSLLASSKSLPFMYYSMLMANNLKKSQENQLLSRYSRCIKIRPDIYIESSLETLNSSVDYYFSDEDYRHADIVAMASSQTMDRVCSYIGRVDCSQSADKLRRDYSLYLSEKLAMKCAPLSYGSDWWILRSSTFKFN